MKRQKWPLLLCALLVVLAVTVCLLPAGGGGIAQTPPEESGVVLTLASPTPTPEADQENAPSPGPDLPIEGEYYYDLTSVVLYLELFNRLPDNYLSKTKARDLGWSGGSLEPYFPGGAIGGSRFGNLEGLLPEAKGRDYTECDLNTNGKDSRGAERLVFSNDGLYFYTGDHYESFTEYVVTGDWQVIPK